MALEEALVECTKAINGLAALMSKGAPAAGIPVEARRGPGRPKAVTIDEVKAIAEKVREEKGKPAAVALIVKHGAETLAEMDKSKYAAFVAAAEVLLAGNGDEPGDEGEAEL